MSQCIECNLYDGNHYNWCSRLRKNQKPPLGVMPRQLWNESRMADLKRAIIQYTEAGLKVNPDWIDEYNELRVGEPTKVSVPIEGEDLEDRIEELVGLLEELRGRMAWIGESQWVKVIDVMIGERK